MGGESDPILRRGDRRHKVHARAGPRRAHRRPRRNGGGAHGRVRRRRDQDRRPEDTEQRLYAGGFGDGAPLRKGARAEEGRLHGAEHLRRRRIYSPAHRRALRHLRPGRVHVGRGRKNID